MQFTTLLTAALAAATSAAATPVDVAERGCKTVYPAGLPLPFNFYVSKTSPAYLTFNTAGAVGSCNLVALVPQGYAGFSSTGNAQLNVYALGGNAPGALVGTTTLRPNGALTTINSFACAPTMPYRFEIASADGTASVSLQETAGVGIYMTYGC